MKTWRILNLGAGVQSTAVYLLAHEISLWGEDLLDFAIFADTGEEPQDVYQHLAWLQRHGSIPIIIRTKGKLGNDLTKGQNSTGQRFTSIPAFTTETEGESGGMTRRQCSKEYKLEVIERSIRRDVIGLAPRQRVPKGVHVKQYFGISMDEAGRSRRIKDAIKHKWIEPKFPLIKLGWTRTDCLNYLSDKVPHEVPKSACVFCPYHSDAEWLRIQNNPQDWARAVEIDAALRTTGSVANRDMRQKMYVHRSCLPLTQITFKPQPTIREQQTNLAFMKECLGVCGN